MAARDLAEPEIFRTLEGTGVPSAVGFYEARHGVGGIPVDPKVPVGSTGAQFHAMSVQMAQNVPKIPQNEPKTSQNDQNACKM